MLFKQVISYVSPSKGFNVFRFFEEKRKKIFTGMKIYFIIYSSVYFSWHTNRPSEQVLSFISY